MNSILIISIICIFIGFAINCIRPDTTPFLDIKRKGAKVLVLACIDPRFTERLAHFLIHNKQVHADYDLINLAGASLGVLQKDYPSWKQMFYDHVNLAIKLHNIKEIWCFDHLDCGMYKASLDIKEDHDVEIHAKNILQLRKIIAEAYPEIRFRGFVLMTDGTIQKTTDSE